MSDYMHELKHLVVQSVHTVNEVVFEEYICMQILLGTFYLMNLKKKLIWPIFCIQLYY